MTQVSDHPNTPNPTSTSTEIDAFPADKVWEMLTAIDIAVLVTQGSDGLRGRPMSTIPTPEKGVIYILTEAQSSAARDIRVDGKVILSYVGMGDQVAVAGVATVNPDKELVKDLWNPGAQVFWPKGPEAHDVVTLVIDPDHVDVWDGHGMIRGIVNLMKGSINGTQPDLGTRGQTTL